MEVVERIEEHLEAANIRAALELGIISKEFAKKKLAELENEHERSPAPSR